MKVLFLTLYPEMAASSRYRVHQFIPYLTAQGMECTVACAVEEKVWRNYSGPQRKGRPFWYHLHETRTRRKQLQRLKGYDCIFLQKGLMTAYLKGMHRYLDPVADKLVYDLDDAVHLAPPHPLSRRWDWLEDGRQVEKILERASLVLAGNHWLEEKVSAWAQNVKCFPTVVDTERFQPAVQPPESYTLGWIGSPSTVKNLDKVLGLILGISKVQLQVVGAQLNQPDLAQVRCRDWTLEGEVEAIQQFSVGLMPLTDTPWNRGKCALKALLYMACGVPCIASPVGAVQDIITHGENGLLAATPEEWIAAIEALRDPAYRQQLGHAARSTVEKHYSLHHAAPRLATLLAAYR